MSGPYPHEHLAEPPPLSREQQFMVDRLHALAAVANDEETILAPCINDKIAHTMLRVRECFDRANKLMSWGDYDRAEGTINQIEAGLGELRGVAKELGMRFMERIIP